MMHENRVQNEEVFLTLPHLVLAVIARGVAEVCWPAVRPRPVPTALGPGDQVGGEMDVRQLPVLVKVHVRAYKDGGKGEKHGHCL